MNDTDKKKEKERERRDKSKTNRKPKMKFLKEQNNGRYINNNGKLKKNNSIN